VIAADVAKQAEVSQAWNQVLSDLQTLEHIQANRDIANAFDDMNMQTDWQEIDAAFEDLQHDLGW